MSLFDTNDPGSAKLRFSLRPVINWALVAIFFFAVAVLFDNVGLDIVAGIMLILAFVYLLEKRPVGFRCPGCKKVILSNTPWVCKACGVVNRQTDSHSFLSRCGNIDCGVEPKAYRCHHRGCGEMIFFTEDHDDTNYASCLNARSERPKPDEKQEQREQKRKSNQENVEDKQHEILMAELEEKLRKIKEASKEPKIKTKFEQKKENFDDFYNGVMGMREYARKKRAEAAETYKDDPESLKDAIDAINEFLRRSA